MVFNLDFFRIYILDGLVVGIWLLLSVSIRNIYFGYSKQIYMVHIAKSCNTVKPVYNDHLMGYFSALWRAT